jgi:hypothetical protein
MQHLDEGTIHAWLDGALAPDESRRVEAHAASCDTCATLVAEARGLIAASSRILTALDDVPAGVIPLREGDGAVTPDDLAAMRAKKAVVELSRRRRWWRQPRAVAAAGIVFMAAGTLVVMQRAGDRASAVAAFERAADSATERPAEQPAPVPSAAAPAVDRVDQTRPGSPTVGAGAAERGGGRLAREEAAQRNESRRSELQRRVADEPSRDVAGAVALSAVQTRPDSLAAMKQRVQSQVGAQSGAQHASAPTQQQQASPANVGRSAPTATRLAPVLTPPPSSAALADSASRPARERDFAAEAARREMVNPEKALLSPLVAGCYQIHLAAGMRGSSLVPRAVMLDTVVAATRGDTSWYRAQSLDSPPLADVELTWRPMSRPEAGAMGAEIATRRGQFAEAFMVTIERTGIVTTGAAPKAADARAAPYTALQTICPRR